MVNPATWSLPEATETLSIIFVINPSRVLNSFLLSSFSSSVSILLFIISFSSLLKVSVFLWFLIRFIIIFSAGLEDSSEFASASHCVFVVLLL